MLYTVKDYDTLLGLEGFSDTLLKNHFTLYQGYVTNTNKLAELLKEKDVTTPEYAELKRRFGWEWNGMRLHEYYFDNLLNDGAVLGEGSELLKKIIEDFGTFENWEKDFRSVGAMRGIGWVILSHDKKENRLFNVWINEHDAGHFVGGNPLLVMDVFEHSFMTDYGLKRAEYILSFWKAVNWAEVEKRFLK
jgi:Fe-Mn family superoxide dismutase